MQNRTQDRLQNRKQEKGQRQALDFMTAYRSLALAGLEKVSEPWVRAIWLRQSLPKATSSDHWQPTLPSGSPLFQALDWKLGGQLSRLRKFHSKSEGTSPVFVPTMGRLVNDYIVLDFARTRSLSDIINVSNRMNWGGAFLWSESPEEVINLEKEIKKMGRTKTEVRLECDCDPSFEWEVESP